MRLMCGKLDKTLGLENVEIMKAKITMGNEMI